MDASRRGELLGLLTARPNRTESKPLEAGHFSTSMPTGEVVVGCPSVQKCLLTILADTSYADRDECA
jgi:hypothetical protein